MRRFALVWLVLAALLVCARVAASGADFTVVSQSPGNTFVAAADFNTVAVAMTDPGTPLRGTVALAATASSERGIASVQFQSSPAGAGTWTDACLATVAPYTCDWDTAGVADGSRDLRAVAVDQAGYQKTSTVSARLIDNTIPSGTLADPGVMTGTESLSATGSDGGSGLSSLAISYRSAGGGAWTSVCSGATSPQNCNLNTVPLADGSYELKATATDVAGNVRDTFLTRTVDNTAPTVAVTSPGSAIRGTVSIGATAGDGAGTGVASVTIQYKPMVGGSWTSICADNVAPYSCSFNTTTAGGDGQYQFQAIAADGVPLNGASAAVQNVWIDNTVPSASTLTNPGTPFGGVKALSGTATDAGSGIATWTVQYRTAGGGTWTDACSDTTASYTCNWTTTGIADGLYDMRAVATDNAGNATTSTTITNRRIDNTAPTASLTNPGTPLSGTVTLNATGTDSVGVASVSFQRSPAGAGTWTQICLDTTSAYSCSFDTTAVSDGTYDLRSVTTDTAGNQTASTVVANRVIDNAPKGVDIQTANGGGTAGRLQQNDSITLTFNEPILTTSVLAGWNGTSQAIRVVATNNASADRMDLQTTGGARLPLVLSNIDLVLNGNFVSATVTFNATMVQSGNAIVITLGTQIGSGGLQTAAAGTMTWRPSATLTDATAHACSTATVTETGGSDVDF